MLYGLAPTGAYFLSALPLVALWGLSVPALQSVATRRVGPSEQGQLQGAQASLGSLADMTGPLMFSQIFAAAISLQGPVHIPGAPFFLAGIFVAVALCVCWPIGRPTAAE